MDSAPDIHGKDLTLDALFAAGWFAESGAPGLYARSGEFEAVVAGIEAMVTAAGGPAEVWRFPPAMSRTNFTRSGYFKNFPQLCGCVHSFSGDEKEQGRVMRAMAADEPWGDAFGPSEVAMVPAACYPLYPILAKRGPLPKGGATANVQAYCFRHEPSLDPGRLQMFRQLEYVRVGTADEVLNFREAWLEKSREIMTKLDLWHRVEIANDPFFGRTGKLMAASQRENELKFELLMPVASAENLTACVSFNYHQQYLGQTWDLVLSDGETAHTACVGFGLERTTLALVRRHGLKLADWPQTVRASLRL